MMLHQVVDALKKRSDLAGWTVRHIQTRGVHLRKISKIGVSQVTAHRIFYAMPIAWERSASFASCRRKVRD